MKKRILYGVANYEEIIAENGYFVDKTRYILELEMIRNPVFLPVSYTHLTLPTKRIV